jgi:transcriptional regulator with XRE-family HTH domain
MPDADPHPIRRWRLSQTPPLTLEQMAQRAGVHKGQLSKIESGLKEPRLATLRRLVLATGEEVSADAVVWWSKRNNCAAAA